MTMMRTGSLLDGTDPTTLGTELNYNDDEERYQKPVRARATSR